MAFGTANFSVYFYSHLIIIPFEGHKIIIFTNSAGGTPKAVPWGVAKK